MKDFRILFALMLGALLGFTSCEESDSVGEYDNWQARNVQFVDSIATVARANADGRWKVFLADGLDESKVWDNKYYVYCYSLQNGNGTESPRYTDFVSVNYRGYLMPTAKYPQGYIFDSNYEGELDSSFDVPSSFLLGSTVQGLSTAVQHMVKGDTWKVYIPANLGYGGNVTGYIPAYSTLVFDINLVDFSSTAAQ
jgi:FKBP-type peptidyl-prolyl cis-trans isomerase FklB